MIDRKEELVLRADLPGLELTIRGERKEEKEAKAEDYYCCERWTGAFARSIALPPGVETERVKATFRKGILEIHSPR